MDHLKQVLSQKIERSQALLGKWRDPKSGLSDKEILGGLTNILDNGVLEELKKIAEIRRLPDEHAKSI